ncbi:MAG TPA: prephenate dehydratase domain-containing protein [Polyangiaceae bacterium]
MDHNQELGQLRARIAELDAEIVAKLDARARASREIRAHAEAEAVADVPEQEWLERLLALSSGDLPGDSLRQVLRQIRSTARGIEQPEHVAYLGPEGSFCHHEAVGYFGAASTFIECPSVEEALDEVVRGRAVHAVFPFESSVDGLVQSSVTALSRTDLVIVAERSRPSTEQLMSRADNATDVEKVYATAAARISCSRFLDKELPRASIIDVRSPAVAATLASEDSHAAALLPAATGVAAGLRLLRENVGDIADLRLRYCVVGQRPASRSSADLTCLLFGVDDAPGALFDVLKHFSERGINVKKMHSRPAQRELTGYVFYAEIVGHVSDRQVITALEGVKRSTKYLKVLGSFPVVSS